MRKGTRLYRWRLALSLHNFFRIEEYSIVKGKRKTLVKSLRKVAGPLAGYLHFLDLIAGCE
jgi:hypothetical protein